MQGCCSRGTDTGANSLHYSNEMTSDSLQISIPYISQSLQHPQLIQRSKQVFSSISCKPSSTLHVTHMTNSRRIAHNQVHAWIFSNSSLLLYTHFDEAWLQLVLSVSLIRLVPAPFVLPRVSFLRLDHSGTPLIVPSCEVDLFPTFVWLLGHLSPVAVIGQAGELLVDWLVIAIAAYSWIVVGLSADRMALYPAGQSWELLNNNCFVGWALSSCSVHSPRNRSAPQTPRNIHAFRT